MDLSVLLCNFPGWRPKPLGERCPQEGSGAGRRETRAALAQISLLAPGSPEQRSQAARGRSPCFPGIHFELCSSRAAKKGLSSKGGFFCRVCFLKTVYRHTLSRGKLSVSMNTYAVQTASSRFQNLQVQTITFQPILIIFDTR